jgi:S-adenosylmethionine:tRNA ribosyltransferase-isomerase
MASLIQDYDYHLPPELVAQYPLLQRDASRLLVLNRGGGEIHHGAFRDLPHRLDHQDVLVVNDTRVFPARLRGLKDSGGKIELLLHHLPEGEENLGRGGKGSQTTYNSSPKPSVPTPKEIYQAVRVRATYRGRLKPGQSLDFGPSLQAEVISLPLPGVAEVLFTSLNGDVCQAVLQAGEVPLPPYIHRPPEGLDQGRYQTVYAARPGAIAAPTAGLHFTQSIMDGLKRRGIEVMSLTLHVGPGTFAPVRHPDYTRHRLEPEYFELSAQSARLLNEARARGKRLVAVGTTTTRVLEFCAGEKGFTAQRGWCDLYIYPGYRFRAVDRLLTNFHLPRTSLLLLVSAFAGREQIIQAYAEAISQKYRFYSYGDCMLII